MPALRKTLNEKRTIAIKKALTAGMIEKGWTQQHLALLTGMHRQLIGKIINHPLERKVSDVFTVADKLGVNIGEALTER